MVRIEVEPIGEESFGFSCQPQHGEYESSGGAVIEAFQHYCDGLTNVAGAYGHIVVIY